MRVRPLFILIFMASSYLQASSLEQLLEFAIRNHPQLCAEQEQICAVKAKKGEARSFFHPQVNAIGGHQEEDLNLRKDSYRYGYFELRWNLFRGGKDQARLKIAHEEEAISYCEMEKTFQAVLKDIAVAYFKYLSCREKVRIYASAGEYLDIFAPIAKRKQEAGFETAVDAKEIDYHRLHYKALMKQAEIEAYLALTDLKFSTGGACQEYFEDLSCDFLGLEILPPLEEVCQSAYNTRPERLIIERLENMHTARLNSAKGEHMPELDLIGVWGRENELQDERGTGTKAVIELKIPLYAGWGHYFQQRKEQAILRRQKLLSVELDQQIAKQVHSAYHKVESINAHLEVVNQVANDRDTFLNAVHDEYKRGVRNSGDVVSAVAFMTDVEIQCFEGWRDYSIARTELAWAAGDILSIFNCNH